jgi:hypothetical protein
MKGMNKGTRSIPQGKKSGSTVQPKPHTGKGSGSSQWGGSKPTGGRV